MAFLRPLCRGAASRGRERGLATMTGVSDMFRIGVGPSSSHTVGPMRAAAACAKALEGRPFAHIGCDLLGSLAWTGAGHATDKAVILGLAGFEPDTIEPAMLDEIAEQARVTRRLCIAGRDIAFDPAVD